MSEPKDLRLGDSISTDGLAFAVNSLNTGVPHAVVLVDDLDAVDVQRLGSAIRHRAHFAPRGTNANFIHAIDEKTIAIRTYERGVEAETLACGTGVVASAIIYHELTESFADS